MCQCEHYKNIYIIVLYSLCCFNITDVRVYFQDIRFSVLYCTWRSVLNLSVTAISVIRSSKRNPSLCILWQWVLHSDIHLIMTHKGTLSVQDHDFYSLGFQRNHLYQKLYVLEFYVRLTTCIERLVNSRLCFALMCAFVRLELHWQ